MCVRDVSVVMMCVWFQCSLYDVVRCRMILHYICAVVYAMCLWPVYDCVLCLWSVMRVCLIVFDVRTIKQYCFVILCVMCV